MDPTLTRFGTGAAAGVAGTAVMTGFMRTAQRAGWMGELPPKKIASAALDQLEVPRTEDEEHAASMALHFAFGAGCGALFNLLPRQRAGRVPAPLQGIAFASMVWLVSYWGWVPALGIMPTPPKDRPGRPTSMVLAHFIFGGVMGSLLGRRR